ncbi:hypothetical protein BLNAU_14529 [Blattamonas nauphoetae]|uniref:PPPDE domain-containing protein n=1 Tax=Blattamonas nauphoetae TaxID=2049346 RepID=A0ABQ9XH46_9EUKA|nr:hypothetical protein BLNAU_14529 [Blattamonas nauphoetae]
MDHTMVLIVQFDENGIIAEIGWKIEYTTEGIKDTCIDLTSDNQEDATIVTCQAIRPDIDFATIHNWLNMKIEKYNEMTYALFKNNCQHFSREFYNFLTKTDENTPDDPLVTKYTNGVKNVLGSILNVIVVIICIFALTVRSGVVGRRDSRKKLERYSPKLRIFISTIRL